MYQAGTAQVYIRSHVQESLKVVKNLMPENLYLLKFYNFSLIKAIVLLQQMQKTPQGRNTGIIFIFHK